MLSPALYESLANGGMVCTFTSVYMCPLFCVELQQLMQHSYTAVNSFAVAPSLADADDADVGDMEDVQDVRDVRDVQEAPDRFSVCVAHYLQCTSISVILYDTSAPDTALLYCVGTSH